VALEFQLGARPAMVPHGPLEGLKGGDPQILNLGSVQAGVEHRHGGVRLCGLDPESLRFCELEGNAAGPVGALETSGS
jgi:hypothetical protein